MRIPRISITVKNALVYLVIIALTSATLGYAIYRLSSAKVLENTTLTLIHNNETVVLHFDAYLQDVRKDAIYLSKNPFLGDYLQGSGGTALRDKIALEFLALLAAKNHYAQIRVIGLENKGKEQIRVDQLDDRLFVVPDSMLQVKGDRDYFRETIRLPQDSIYFSAINLNQEYGKIFVPHTPTLRVGTPLFRDGRVWGIVIINVDLRPFFTKLKQLAGQQNALKLFNAEGYYLIHPDSNRSFRFEFGHGPDVDPAELEGSWTPAQLPSSSHGAYFDKVNATSVVTYDYPRKNYQLYFTLEAAQADLLAVFNRWKWSIVNITLGFIFGAVLLAIWWTRRQARQFREITQSIIDFGKSPNVVALDIARNDEIGDLAKSFQEMSSRIHHYVWALREAKSEADAANRAKQDFIENMSHEMRNPLQSILGMVHLLEQHQPRQDQKTFLENLRFSAEHLRTLVNDILDYRKLINDQIVLHPENLELEDYFQQLIKGHLFESSRKKIRILLELSDELENRTLSADPVRLGQVINNLMTNAIRYAPEGSEVRLGVTEAKGEGIQLSIADQGPGMSDENIANVLAFKPVTGEVSHSQSVGLGLPIAIRLLSLMGSKLHIDRNQGSGLRFHFVLPTQLRERTLEKKQARQNESLLHKLIKHGACIDDDAQNAFYYQHLFEQAGIQLSSFDNPGTLLESAEPFDLIITDIHFQDTHLQEHLSHLRKHLGAQCIIIAVTGMDDQPEWLTDLSKGVDALLQKPVSPDQLLEAVEFAMFQKRFGDMQLKGLVQQYDGDREKVRAALELMGKEWTDLSNKLQTAMVAGDRKEFERIAHRLANGMRLTGLETLENTLREIGERTHLSHPASDEDLAMVQLAFRCCIRQLHQARNQPW
ncbi:MAG: response regulator [Saprospiraceae bacterium]|jgi:signal transduction histidine kinase/CheY-like chemotaxis protein|nr:response regulator [Saprospiraceae bacterium]MBP9210149.1 response regulator [Saprospiraceae bacterium]